MQDERRSVPPSKRGTGLDVGDLIAMMDRERRLSAIACGLSILGLACLLALAVLMAVSR